MAKKTPADWQKEGDELKATIMAAKKKPQNFGLVIAGEGMILKTHPTHSCDKLFKEAKSSEGGTAKGIQGVMTVSGTQIEFKYEGSEKDIPGGFETKFKQYLTLVKVKGFKPEFVPSIAPAAPEAKEKPKKEAAPEVRAKSVFQKAEAKVATRGQKETPSPEAAKKKKTEISAAMKKLKDEIQAAAKTGAPQDKSELQALVKKFQSDLNAEKLADSEDGLEAIRKKIAAIGATQKKIAAEKKEARKKNIAEIRARAEKLRKMVEKIATA